MSFLYITADVVGQPDHGGGTVTANESAALASLGPTTVIGRKQLEPNLVGQDPWCWDRTAYMQLPYQVNYGITKAKGMLAHFYAGTFSETVRELKSNGAKVSYTAAAHSIDKSRAEHERLGFAFNYPHLTDPVLWERYVRGYKEADLVICPSSYSAGIMRGYGCGNVVVVPHGVNLPEQVQELPQQFRVGYLGSFGPDKGVDYLLQAWGKLNYKDAVLVLAGRDSTSPWVKQQAQKYGGNVVLKGWVENVSDFYNGISLYIQASCSEGFGLEVLEALAHGRPVLCSDGAGAADVVAPTMRFPACNANALADTIHMTKAGWMPDVEQCCRTAENYTWDKIRQKYIEAWQGLLS